jgi:serine/threonine-protein kinase
MEFGTTENIPVDVVIPGYRLRRQIGSDAIGLWFAAEQEKLGRGVLLKVLRPQYEHHEQARREFLAEMDRLSPLDHPCLPHVIDTFREGPLAIVLECSAERNLAEALEPRKGLGESVSCEHARDVASALAYLWERGFAHRNVSPSMILPLEGGRSRLITFRLVLPVAEFTAQKGKLSQDANYVAPEQVGGEAPIGATTHVYQVAALLHHMLAGRPPYPGTSPAEIAAAHVKEEFPSLKRTQPYLRKGIYGLLAASTQKDPALRPSLPELVEALEAILAGKDPGIEPPKGEGGIQLRSRRRRR